MAKSEAKIKFTAETSGFTEGIKKADSEIKTLRSELKLNATQLKGNADSVDLLKERQKLLGDELDRARDKVDLTSKKYEKATQVMGENSREAQTLKRQLLEAQNQEAAIGNEIESVNKKIAEQEKAEKSLRNEVKELDRQVSDYDKSLEYNQAELDGAKNKTELLRERQTLLKGAYETSAQRVDALTAALEECGKEVGTNSDEYHELQDELSDARIKQQELKNAIGETTKELNETTSGMNKFAEGLNGAGQKIESVGDKLTVLSGAIVGVGTATGVMASNFENDMANLSTLLDDDSHLQGYEDAVKRISNETGKDLSDISDGMYQAVSSLGDGGKKTMDIFEVMAKSAKAGGAETAESVELISAGMKGYNSVNEQTAQKISDLAFQTQKLGVTTFPEMAKSMQPLFPLSSSLNISYEELFGSMATLTGVTGNTSEVSTQLKAVFSNLLKPTEAMSDLMEEYGYANGAAMIESEGLSGVLMILQDATGGQADQLAQLFSSTEALTAMTALTGTQFDTFNDKLGKMSEAAGATDSALEKVSSTAGDQVRTSLNELKNTGEELGETVLEELNPIIEQATEKVHGFTEWFTGLNDEQKTTIVKIAAVVAAIGPMLIVVGKVTQGISTLIGIIRTVRTVFAMLNLTMLASPVTWIVLGIVALVAIFVVLWNKCDGFRNFWINLWDGIKEKFGAAVDFFKNGFEKITGFFTSLPEKTSDKVNEFKTGVKEGFEEAAGKATEAMEKGYNKIDELTGGRLTDVVNLTKNHLGAMKTAYETNGGGIKGITAATMTHIKGVTTMGYTALNKITGGKLGEMLGMTRTNLSNMKSAYETNGGGIKGITAATMEGIKGITSIGYTAINNITGGKLGEMLGMTRTNLSNMKSAYEENGGGIRGIVAATTTGIKGTWEMGYNMVNELTGGKLDELRGKFTDKMDSIKNIVSDAVRKLKDLFDFDWSLPRVKMPHFSISGSFSIKPPSVPTISCEWYANGAVLTKPTIFGMNGDRQMVGGEAGMEAILPVSILQEYIENAMVKFIGLVPQIDYVKLESVIDSAMRKHPRMKVLSANRRELLRLIEED